MVGYLFLKLFILKERDDVMGGSVGFSTQIFGCLLLEGSFFREIVPKYSGLFCVSLKKVFGAGVRVTFRCGWYEDQCSFFPFMGRC